MKKTSVTSGHLLDVNLLIALAWPSHTSHAGAMAWFLSPVRRVWHTCVITQSAFLRLSINPSFAANHVSANVAATMLINLTSHPDHRYLGDMPDLTSADYSAIWPRVRKHAEMSDAALVCTAKHNNVTLATFDQGISKLSPWPDVVELLV